MKIQQHINKKENQRCWNFYQIKEMRKQVIQTVAQFISPTLLEQTASSKSNLDFYGERLYNYKREKCILN